MALADEDVNPYDRLAFPGQPVTQTHPSRLAAVGLLFGMRPASIDRCRVLELGCAVGANLVPLAEAYPQSTFVGIDYSERQIEAGRRVADSLGLANLELKTLSIADVDRQFGEFDYILCHGVFSWVGRELQEKILEVCRERLAPQGIAYISYNAYPGWHFRKIIREMALHANPSGRTAIDECVARTRQVLDFMAFAFSGDERPYARMLKQDLDSLPGLPDAYLFHEFLEEENEPLYVHEFAARLPAHELQYLGDPMPANLFAERYGAEIAGRVLSLGADIVSVEQHLDLARETSFRQSLVCHQAVGLQRKLEPHCAEGLFFSGDVRPAHGRADVRSTEMTTFLVAGKWKMLTPQPLVKAAFCHLGQQWPRAVSFDELAGIAGAAIGHRGALAANERELLAIDLIGRVVMARLAVFAAPSPFVITAGSLPQTSAAVRQQVAEGADVTNRLHEIVRLEPLSARLIALLDGQHTRGELATLVTDLADRGELPQAAEAALAAFEIRRGNRGAAIVALVEHLLADFGRRALLIA